MAARIYYKVIFNTFTDWKVHLRCPETTHVSITPPLPRQLLILVEKMINIKVVFTNDREGFSFFLNKMTAPPPPQYTMGMLVGGKIILWSIQDSNSFCHISLCARAQRQCQHCAITVLDAFMWPVHRDSLLWPPALEARPYWLEHRITMATLLTGIEQKPKCRHICLWTNILWQFCLWPCTTNLETEKVPCSQGWYTVRINHCSQF